MGLLAIRYYPDPVLLGKSEPVTDFSAATQKFFDDLIETMYVEDGVGLAAPQVGILKQALAVSPRGKEGEEMILVNPQIYEMKGRETGKEGCLSFPGVSAVVPRARIIRIRFQDRNGEAHDLEMRDFLARVVQHETDHLNGVVFIDRVDFNQRQKLLAEYRPPGP